MPQSTNYRFPSFQLDRAHYFSLAQVQGFQTTCKGEAVKVIIEAFMIRIGPGGILYYGHTRLMLRPPCSAFRRVLESFRFRGNGKFGFRGRV